MEQIQPGGDDKTASREQLDAALALARGSVQEAGRVLAQGWDEPGYEQARQVIRRQLGLIGELDTLRADLSGVQTEETVSAVDSEMALLWWDRYPLHRWVANRLHWRTRALLAKAPVDQRPVEPATLMIARLDGPTELVVRRMIDDAVKAEAAGPAGRVYLDARGVGREEGVGEYDRSLGELAALLLKHSALPTRLDSRPTLFGPGQCPEAMLYCGWYRLRAYVDAFDFVPGAVAFHMASFEAVSLRGAGERGWCKGLLNDGAAATLGPVAEPYLQSFPLPADFFGLLLTGRYCLAECFAYTSPFNSWMMILLGDPLYRPFAARPVLTMEQLFDRRDFPLHELPGRPPTTQPK